MYPILLDGYLTEKRLKAAWREIDYSRTLSGTGPPSLVLVINSAGGEMEAAMETVKRLRVNGDSFAAKIYRAESAAAYLALCANKSEIVREGVFRLDLGGTYIPSNMLVTDEKVAASIVDEAKRWRKAVFTALEKRGFPKTGPLVNRLLTRNELSFTPEQCIRFGLVDRIV